MQYQRGEGIGKDDFEILGDLPKKNIDTGLGVERLAMLLQGVENFYETDQVRPVLDAASKLSGKKYHGSESAEDEGLRGRRAHARGGRPHPLFAHADCRWRDPFERGVAAPSCAA